MRCQKAEEQILRSLDGFLDEGRRERFEEHLRACSACRKKEKEYRVLQGLLKSENDAAPLPRFLERLEMRIREEKKPLGLILWEKWCLRAIPVFLGLALAFGAALIVFVPRTQERMTQSELLLLKDQYTMSEVQTIFEGGKAEDKHLRLIFAAADDRTSQRRKIP